MIKIGIVRGKNAFLPEVDAYVKAFNAVLNVEVIVFDNDSVVGSNCDLTIVFCGLIPFWKRYPGALVVEYHSLSTGRWARAKDIIKRMVNVRGDYYVFLNNRVRRGLMFGSRLPHSLRGMGYDPDLADKYRRLEKKYDFIYCGTIRTGVVEKIEHLAALGFSVVVAGASGANHIRLLNNPTGLISSLGRVSLESAYKLMGQSVYGLSVTPDIHPFNMQDSTKIIEYLGIGLKVVSNRYRWVDEFEVESGARIMDISAINNRIDVEEFPFESGDIWRWSWPQVMSRSQIVPVVCELARAAKDAKGCG